MVVDLGYVTCPRCEGTGQKLNWYDPSKQPDIYGTNALVESYKRFSPSGREVLNEKCPLCIGKGKLSKWYLYVGGCL